MAGKVGVGVGGACSSSGSSSHAGCCGGGAAFAVQIGRTVFCSISSPDDVKKQSAAAAISAGALVSVVTMARMWGGRTPARISFAIISKVIFAISAFNAARN